MFYFGLFLLTIPTPINRNTTHCKAFLVKRSKDKYSLCTFLPSTKVPKGANDIMTEASLAPVIFYFHVFSLI